MPTPPLMPRTIRPLLEAIELGHHPHVETGYTEQVWTRILRAIKTVANEHGDNPLTNTHPSPDVRASLRLLRIAACDLGRDDPARWLHEATGIEPAVAAGIVDHARLQLAPELVAAIADDLRANPHDGLRPVAERTGATTRTVTTVDYALEIRSACAQRWLSHCYDMIDDDDTVTIDACARSFGEPVGDERWQAGGFNAARRILDGEQAAA